MCHGTGAPTGPHLYGGGEHEAASRGRPEVRRRVARRRRVASKVAVPARGELDEEELEGTAALVQG